MPNDEPNLFTAPAEAEACAALGSLALAHMGDAVYELLVRRHLCEALRGKNAGLHAATVKLVNASAQARAAAVLLPLLTEEEADVFRRGRNAKVRSTPKNASTGDYHTATGLEALFGYLFLTGRTARISELFTQLLRTEADQPEQDPSYAGKEADGDAH